VAVGKTIKGDWHILIVEDSPTQADSLRYLLESQGYDCVIAGNGSEALETLARYNASLIISDVIMPEMDGFELCKRVKSDDRLKDIPVILLTSLVEFSDVILGLECEADIFVTKPYEEDYLLDKIEYLLTNYKLRLRDVPRKEIEVEMDGKLHLITSGRRQILDLLLSIYEQAVRINRKLKQREQELEASNARLAVLHAINVTMSQSLDLTRILNDALAELAETLDISTAAVFLLEGDSLMLRAERNFPDDLAEKILSRQPDPERLAAAYQDLRRFNGQPLMVVQLRAKWSVNGLLVIQMPGQVSTEKDSLRDDSELLQGIANHLAVAIENARLYEAAKQARKAAEDASRSKDAFLAMVTHELRNPLNAMLGWTRILRTKQIDEEMRHRALEIIEQSARTQSQLIEDLLDTARIASGKMRLDLRPVDLADVIDATIEIVRPAAEAKGIELHRKFDARANIITGDPNRLQQVIWNLLSNAIKFTPQGGRVEVRLQRADPNARITVSDTGRGINPEFLPHIFERFSQQHDIAAGQRKSGLGLGLSLVRHLVELHGGTVVAESPGEGQGATFTINLPIRAVRPKTKSAEVAGEWKDDTSGATRLDGLRILVVDDNQDARDLVAAVLKQYGAQATAAASAIEAFALLETSNGYDVLVSDIEMPDESGYELMRNVRTLPPDKGGQIPAIALTAFGRSTDRIRALHAGFQMHVPKPVEPEELALAVASLVGRASARMNPRIESR
jgi:signal transduction histidine kinase